ncbi:hypothetical protein [Paenibacillus periandrae]|nr:hypothetical protein [Paenibacillus periandrae]
MIRSTSAAEYGAAAVCAPGSYGSGQPQLIGVAAEELQQLATGPHLLG